MHRRYWRPWLLMHALATFSAAASAAEVKLLTKAHDPYGVPRPARGQVHVPLRTSFYVELGLDDKKSADVVLGGSVTIELTPEGGEAVAILRENRQFAPGFTGKLLPAKDNQHGPTLAVYADPSTPLRPATKYRVRVSARSRGGATLPAAAGTWQFTTEDAPTTRPIRFALTAQTPTANWQGSFFTGSCCPSFCTSHSQRIPTNELMAAVRKNSPKAWSLQRDFWMTGMEHQPGFLSGNLPGIVRERETRRIKSIDQHSENTMLRVEDFFGHEQYGIPSNRPVSADYHQGDEILIGDGVNSARAKVVAVDDRERTVRVTRVEAPSGGWQIAYKGPLPTKENPDAPGLFPPGGCYLRKFSPAGTPAYYWGRLDCEWDLAHRRFKRRLMPNFADAPGDLSIDGRNWTTAKDYAELHEVTRAITSHILERYGDACLDFPWSVFNEPDLGVLFWRADWTELQRFYDYTVDGILRAFEDHGYDASRVFIGGLELGGIFGTNLRVREFLAHCSPRAQVVKGMLPLNAAFADRRLDGKRSKRVEDLCRANDGRGSPCDFISIHAYNRAQLMADKLIRAKENALEIDPVYYAKLWVNSHEACPGWQPPPDPAYGDSYLGNGYFPTWCAEVARRLLQRAATDPRYGYGESILTFWPWPNAGFGGGNDCVRAIPVDDDGDGKTDRTVTVAMPILHFLGLLAQMGPEFRVLPEQVVGGHVVSGIASRSGEVQRMLVYSHYALDTESRSDVAFDVTLDLTGLRAGRTIVNEYGFDKDRNSYFHLGRSLREQGAPTRSLDKSRAEELQTALQELGRDQKASQLAGLQRLTKLGADMASAAEAIVKLHERTTDPEVREKAMTVLKRLMSPRAYPAKTVAEVEERSRLRRTSSTEHVVGADGKLQVTVRVAGNGANFLVLEPTPKQ